MEAQVLSSLKPKQESIFSNTCMKMSEHTPRARRNGGERKLFFEDSNERRPRSRKAERATRHSAVSAHDDGRRPNKWVEDPEDPTSLVISAQWPHPFPFRTRK